MATETLGTIPCEECEKRLDANNEPMQREREEAQTRGQTSDAKELLTLINDAMEYGPQQAGVKLEYVNGISVWEAMPVYRHQRKTLDMQISLLDNAAPNGCGCHPIADVTILFPDGSYKRPDIAVYCTEPADQDRSVTELPEAVIEIISAGYEKKDTEVSLPFYLAQGIPDIVLFNPETNRVSHYHDGQIEECDSPVKLTFACGCRVTV